MKALFHVPATVLRFALAAILVLGALAGLFVAGASVASPGHTGQALALRAALHPRAAQVTLKSLLAHSLRWQSSPVGRYVLPRRVLDRRPLAGANGSLVAINEPVQTFDVFAPPPVFQANVALSANNQTPVWSADGTYLVFSSNRSADGHYHLWAISSTGDQPNNTSLVQITSGPGNEFFPALNSANNALTFTSDARSSGTQNLFVLTFNQGQLPTNVDISDTGQSSVTSLTQGTGQQTGFSTVERPTWSPSGQQIAFSAVTTSSNVAGSVGKHHIYFLYVQSGGYLPNGGANNPPGKLSDGPTDDTDPAWSPDGQYIVFASTAASFFNTSQPIAPNPSNPAQEKTPAGSTAGSGTGHSLFVLTANGTVPSGLTGGRLTTTPGDDIAPAFRLRSDNVTSDLSFSRKGTGHYKVFYFTASLFTPAGSGGGAGSEQFFPQDTSGGSAPTQLNTSDAADAFDDVYPTWSPNLSSSPVNSIAYASDRSITYNDPQTGAPSETPISLAAPSTNPKSNNVGGGYTGLLQSQIDNLDPPTLVPFSNSETVHVSDTPGLNGPARRNGDINPGQPVTFTVRLSDREAGVDDNNVYLQIKDPDSKYQDFSGREHKVFTSPYTGTTSGSATFRLFNLGSFSFGGESGVDFAQTINNVRYGGFLLWGVQAASDSANAGVDFGYIGVGRLPANDNSTNPILHTDPNGGTALVPLPGVNPTDFDNPGVNGGSVSAGQEYECQFVNAQFGINGTPGGATDTTGSDYGVPYYLAGLDDQGAHTGSFNTPRGEWLHLTRAATQDTNGGVLYTATWTTPTSPSDYFLDVIAYDKSITGGNSATTTTAGTPASGANWRIYDNVWGFSTDTFGRNGTNDILVVSDNALGQKFAASTFSNQGPSNLLPLFYGAESYMTDIDVNLLPNAIFTYVKPTGAKFNYASPANAAGAGNPPGPPAPSFGLGYNFIPYGTGTGQVAVDAVAVPEALLLNAQGASGPFPVLNGLGVGSYNEDQFSLNGFDAPANREKTSIDGRNVPRSQQYSLWRILARGAVPPTVLAGYQPTFVPQPAVNDTTANFKADAATVPAAPRCVVWVSPYTSAIATYDQRGSLADPATQQNLETYLKAGGRLFVSGQSVASNVTSEGQANNTAGGGGFLPDFLSATLTASGATAPASQKLAPTDGKGHRITSDAFLNVSPLVPAGTPGQYNAINMAFYEEGSDGLLHYITPAAVGSGVYVGNDFDLVVGSEPQWRADGSLDQFGPVVLAFGPNALLGRIDTVAPVTGAHNDAGGAGVIYNENATNGSRTAFASFGLEGVGIDYYHVVVNKQDIFGPHNLRPNLLHNIVCYLRTGTFKGTIRDTSTGSGVVGATVYLRPNGGTTIPGQSATRQCFSTTTVGGGAYSISGVEPGAYTVYAYKKGYNEAASGVNAGGLIADTLHYAVEGDTTASGLDLSITPIPTGSISGKVLDGTNGGPLSGATLSFTASDGTVVTATSGTDGTYTVPGVAPDNYTGTASASGFGTANAPDKGNPVVVTSGNSTTGVNFTLKVQPGTLQGLVSDDFTGQPVGGVTVTVTNPSTSKTVTFTTTATADSNGNNYSGSVLAGTYTVTISTPTNYTNPQPTSQPVTITSNATSTANFTLSSTLGQIGGLVTDAGTGQPLAGATVTFSGNPIPQMTTTSSDPNTDPAPVGDGQPANFSNGQVPDGTYTVTVSATNRFTQTFTVTVNTHQFTRVGPTSGIALVSTLGTLGGLVTDAATGQALSGATVAITDANNNPVTGSPFTTGSATSSPNDGGVTGDGKLVNFYTGTATGATLPQGTYTVTVSDQGQGQAATPDFIPQTFTVQVTAGKFTRVPIPGGVVALVSSYGTVGGLISDSYTKQALGGATVTITDSTGSTVATVTSRSSTTSPGAPTGNGSAQNYSDTHLYGGGTGTTYTLSVADSNHTTQPNIQVTVKGGQFTPANVALVSTQGSLGGLVQDSFSGQNVAGATVTVTDGKGNTVTTFTTTSATSTPPAGLINSDTSPINYGGTLTAGAYTVSVTRRGYGTTGSQNVTISPNTFSRVDFKGSNGLPPTHIFNVNSGGQFLFFSVPYDYASIGVGFDQLFGTLNTGTFHPLNLNPSNANRSHVYVWNPTALQYTVEAAAPADGLHLGQGYWVFVLNSTAATVAGTAPTGTVSVGLQRGWNMIGVPSTTAISVSNLTFNNTATGSTVSFADAASTYRLISPTLYSYNGSSYDAVTAGGSMQPWHAYWIYAFAATTVQIPTK